MSPILIVLLCLYPLLGGSGLIAFMRAARRTSEDWEHHSAVQQIGQTLLYTSDHARSEAPGRLTSRAG